jgi:hypothetical protein
VVFDKIPPVIEAEVELLPPPTVIVKEFDEVTFVEVSVAVSALPPAPPLPGLGSPPSLPFRPPPTKNNCTIVIVRPGAGAKVYEP